MEEIKVGDFIRTKSGNIGKVLDITNVTMQKRKKYLIKRNISKAYYITATRIVKHSPNLIDLVQEGDIIEWYSEIYIGYYGINEIINRFGSIGVYAEEFDAVIDLKNLTIKSVVTKEQFNQVKYEV